MPDGFSSVNWLWRDAVGEFRVGTKVLAFPYSRVGVTREASGPWVLVAGSALEFEGRGLASSDQLRATAFELGERLARSGATLLTGACPGLPDLVAQAFMQVEERGPVLGLSAYATPWHHRAPKPFAPEGFPIRADTVIWTGMGFEHINVLGAQVADAVVALGGGLGTLLEVGAAVELEKPVFAIAHTGGMAGRVDAYLRDFIASFKSYSVREVDSAFAAVSGIVRQCSNGRAKPRGWATATSAMATDGARVELDLDPITEQVSLGFGGHVARYPLAGRLVDGAAVPLAPGAPCFPWDPSAAASRRFRCNGTVTDVPGAWADWVWGPTVDSALLLRAASGVRVGRSVRVITDVGSGTGFLANVLAAQHREALIQCCEPNPVAAELTRWNLRALELERVHVVPAGVGEADLAPADLVVANLPYIAQPPGLPADPMDVFPFQSFTGVSAIRALLRRLPELLLPGGIAYVAFSSCSLIEQNPRYWASLVSAEFTVEVVSERLVPLSIPEVAHDPTWSQFLLDEGGAFRTSSPAPSGRVALDHVVRVAAFRRRDLACA